jgi:hypothetical protein
MVHVAVGSGSRKSLSTIAWLSSLIEAAALLRSVLCLVRPQFGNNFLLGDLAQETMADAQILSNGRNEMTNGCNGHAKQNLDRATEVDDVSIEYFFQPFSSFSCQVFCPKLLSATNLFITDFQASS